MIRKRQALFFHVRRVVQWLPDDYYFCHVPASYYNYLAIVVIYTYATHFASFITYHPSNFMLRSIISLEPFRQVNSCGSGTVPSLEPPVTQCSFSTATSSSYIIPYTHKTRSTTTADMCRVGVSNFTP
jgi:hypothetical protein